MGSVGRRFATSVKPLISGSPRAEKENSSLTISLKS